MVQVRLRRKAEPPGDNDINSDIILVALAVVAGGGTACVAQGEQG